MKSKKYKIRNLILASLTIFIAIILLLLFIIQILSLNKYYEIYKTKQLGKITEQIKKEKSITTSTLEDIAYDNGICISIYENNIVQEISTIYNKGCIFSDKESSSKYITNFINSGKKEETYILENQRFRNKTLIKAIKYDTKYIFLNTSIQPLDSSITLLKSQYGYIVLLLLFISIVMGYFISKKISEPIVELSNSAKLLASGNFNAKFTTTSNIEEIKELANTLELAKNELSKTDELRRDLMANVGHDLKTPLTMIKAYAEMTRDLDTQNKKKRQENMNIIIEETDRLNVLVSDILDLSKLQSKTYELKMEKFDLNELIKDILKRYYILIDNEGYIFKYNNSNDKEVFVYADKKRIEQVIYNLINNAVNYTGKDKTIYINLKDETDKIVVEIKDTGKGIDKEEINEIWDKYYHNEKKHKRNAFGTGLGLSIVKTILETHGYKYGVESKKGKGTMFYFEIIK